MTAINHVRLTSHFFLNEFECPCCRTVRITSELVARLEVVRRKWNHPMVLTSGYRCKRHNFEVGGVPLSKHMEGRAADAIIPLAEMDLVVGLAKEAGFTEIRTYPDRGFMHLGV